MKTIKITSTFLAVICLATSFCVSAFAQTNPVITQIVTLNEMLSSPDKLVYMGLGNKTVKVKSKNGLYERDIASGKSGSIDAPVFSDNKKYLNEIFSVDMEFDFTDGDKNTSFNALQLRAKENNKVCWATDCYTVIIKKDRVEIQAFSNGRNVWLLNRDFDVTEKKRTNVKYGAIDTEKGIYIFVEIGNEVFGALDTEYLIKNSGYMNIEWRTQFKAFETKDDSISIPLETLKYNPLSGDVKKDTILINAGDAQDSIVKERKWYLSTPNYSDIIKEHYGHTFMEMFEVTDGEKKDTFMVMPNDVGLYVLTEITTDSGLIIKSVPEYLNPAKYILSKGYAGVIDCNKAYANGKYIKYDESNDQVCAIEENQGIYLPIRAIVESYNHWVGWNEDTQMVYINAKDSAVIKENINEYDSSFKIGNLGWTTFRFLMGANMSKKPIIYQNRAMIEYIDIGNVLDFKSIIYDENEKLITFCDIPLNLTKADKKYIVDCVMWGMDE